MAKLIGYFGTNGTMLFVSTTTTTAKTTTIIIIITVFHTEVFPT